MNEMFFDVVFLLPSCFLLLSTVIKKYGHELDRSFDWRPTAHSNKLVNASARWRDKFMIERGIFKCIIYGARFYLFMKWLILQF